MSLLLMYCGLAYAGDHLDASRSALVRWLGPGQPAEALVEAREQARLALQDPQEAEDSAAWLHATRVFGMAAADGDGDLAALPELKRAAREAVARGTEPEKVSRELLKVSLKLARHSLRSTIASREGAASGALEQAHAWALQAFELDQLAQELGGEIADQHASTLAVLAGTELQIGAIEEAFAHYEEMRALGQEDVGLARALATLRAEQDLDAALRFLAVDLEKGQALELVELQADLLLKANRPADAVASIVPHLGVHEQDPGVWSLYGRALETAGRPDEARDAMDRCLALSPGEVECLWGRGAVPYRLARAIPLGEGSGKKKKKSEAFQQRKKLYQEALEFLEPAYEAERNHLDVNAALVTIYTELGDRKGLEALQR